MVKVIELGASNTIINNYIAELRNVEVQGDRMRFRRNLERLLGNKAVEQRQHLRPLLRLATIARTALVDVLIVLGVAKEHLVQRWRTQ